MNRKTLYYNHDIQDFIHAKHLQKLFFFKWEVNLYSNISIKLKLNKSEIEKHSMRFAFNYFIISVFILN